jgi:Ca2+-binding RTX toxin-like protein
LGTKSTRAQGLAAAVGGLWVFLCAFLCALAAPAHGDPVVAAAADIACDTTSPFFNGGIGTPGHCRQMSTSNLLATVNPTAVLTAGDNQYHVGSLSDFNASFNPSWGRFKSIIHPEAGDHDYSTAGARGYFDYFNGVGHNSGPAGDRDKGYYSFDLGAWHLIALNAVCDRIDAGTAADGCAAGSPQERWLRSDLATHRSSCTLAYWHSPRFNSGIRGNHLTVLPFWLALHEAGADVVLNGDAHDYERFALQDPGGNADPAGGIREFVIGTGGAFYTGFSTPQPNSEARATRQFGVLALALHATSYDWRFYPEAGGTFTDAGSGRCHGRNPSFSPQSPPGPKALSRTRCTIRGTARNDRLTGTSKRDVICGLGGNDRIRGLGGDDVLRGGAGRDLIWGGTGRDRIDGGAGRDVLRGQSGRDRLVGGAGRDRIYGGAGNDSIFARDRSRDRVSGGKGNDTARTDKADVVRSVEHVRR